VHSFGYKGTTCICSRSSSVNDSISNTSGPPASVLGAPVLMTALATPVIAVPVEIVPQNHHTISKSDYDIEMQL